MNVEQSELLIRIDQNVINLIDAFQKHLTEDKEFQKLMWAELEPLKNDKAARGGARRFATSIYTIISGCIGAIIGIKYGH